MSYRLEEQLPAINFREDDDGTLEAFINDVLQPSVDGAVDDINRYVEQTDIRIAEEKNVENQLSDLGNPFPSILGESEARKRLLASILVEIYKSKGTEQGLTDAIRAVTGIQIVSIVTPTMAEGWDLGVDVLGDDQNDPPVPDIFVSEFAFLGQAPNAHLYSFQVQVDRTLTDEEREILTQIVKFMKVAHEHFLGFIEPSTPLVPDHWELGFSYLHDTGEPLQGDEIDLHE